MINVTIAITSENCTDEKYNKSSLLRKLEEEVTIINKILPMLSVLFNIYLFIIYRNLRPFTRTADYPHRPIIAYGEKKSQQITRTGG